jgi:hypothetical protein
MYAFSRSLKNAEHTVRYSILATEAGWELREEHDSRIVRRVQYQDWHRVERARRTIAFEADALREKGWAECEAR